MEAAEFELLSQSVIMWEEKNYRGPFKEHCVKICFSEQGRPWTSISDSLSIWQDIYSSSHPNFVYFLYRKIAFGFYLMKTFSSPNGHLKTLFMISSSLLV